MVDGWEVIGDERRPGCGDGPAAIRWLSRRPEPLACWMAARRLSRLRAVLGGLAVLFVALQGWTPGDAGPPTAAGPEAAVPPVSNELAAWPLRGDLRDEVGEDLHGRTVVGARARHLVSQMPGSRLLFAGHVGGTPVLLAASPPAALFVRDGSALASYAGKDGTWENAPVFSADGTVFVVHVPTRAGRDRILMIGPPKAGKSLAPRHSETRP